MSDLNEQLSKLGKLSYSKERWYVILNFHEHPTYVFPFEDYKEAKNVADSIIAGLVAEYKFIEVTVGYSLCKYLFLTSTIRAVNLVNDEVFGGMQF